MATLRWTAHDTTPDRVVVFASELWPPSWRVLLAMVRDVRGIAHQLRAADGAYGYALRVQVARRRMTTVSIWRDREAIDAFVRAEPHRSAMERHAAAVRDPRFCAVDVVGVDARLDADCYLGLAEGHVDGAAT